MELNRVGFVGWRGMVGSVLLNRMREENDFSLIAEPVFFSTSQAGGNGPEINGCSQPLADAFDLVALTRQDVIIACQGGDYTSRIHHQLRNQGWQGYWIDAASTLRMNEQATIILDPVNLPVIKASLRNGYKDFIGGNCTVSLMMMALNGLFTADVVEWVTVATYQAISGAGARQMREFVQQMGEISTSIPADADSPVLEMDAQVIKAMRSADLTTREIGLPLAGNLLPWIDKDLDSGISREEWKGSVEVNRILHRDTSPVPIESICVRIGTMRCHSQAFTIKLNRDIPLDEVEHILDGANDWVKVIANERDATLSRLTPAAVTGTLDIPIGRLRKLHIGAGYLCAFTVGDQLLWGAAEPLRRMLRILHEHE